MRDSVLQYLFLASFPVPGPLPNTFCTRETWRRAHVWSLVRRLGHGLGVPALSPVVPLVVGPEGPTLQLSSFLLARGLHVPAIRPPTVPPGTCRYGTSLHCTARSFFGWQNQCWEISFLSLLCFVYPLMPAACLSVSQRRILHALTSYGLHISM